MIKTCKYKAQPIIKAVQWDGNNVDDIIELCGDEATINPKFATGENELYIATDFGIVHIKRNDYVVKISNEVCVYSEESLNSVFELNVNI